MLKITGYSDRIYGRPGDSIKFMVSCEVESSYEAEIVRIICGDENPKGPGIKEQTIETRINGRYKGRKQHIYCGSCAEVPLGPPLSSSLKSFTVQAFIWPTTPTRGRQGIITKWSPANKAGFALFIDEHGSIAIRIGDGSGIVSMASTQVPLQERRWYRVGATFDEESRSLRVFQHPLARVPGVDDAGSSEGHSEIALGTNDSPLVFAATYERGTEHRNIFYEFFNGKIDSPLLAAYALDEPTCEAITSRQNSSLASVLIGAWDFSREMESDRVIDRSPNRLHGRLINFPARAMTGRNWTGEEMDWKQDPSQWGAIHFHDDDV
jgi:N,N-dimethylformamidase